MVPISISGHPSPRGIEMRLGNLGWIVCISSWSYISWNSRMIYVAELKGYAHQTYHPDLRTHCSTTLMYALLMLRRQ